MRTHVIITHAGVRVFSLTVLPATRISDALDDLFPPLVEWKIARGERAREQRVGRIARLIRVS